MVSLTNIAALCAALLMPLNQTQVRNGPPYGWWVVIGSFSEEHSKFFKIESEQTEQAARRCGFRVFNDFSSKFEFRSGYNVFVIDAHPPYVSRREAEAALTVVKRCIPDAYIKYGRYLGE